MADIFVSYARADKACVAPLVAAMEAQGWSVWWDPEIAPGREFDDEIDAALMAAKEVLVVWTPISVASRWVRGEARDAAERGVLVPVRFEQARLPIDVRAIHTTDLDEWSEDPASTPAQECLRALAAMIARTEAKPGSADAAAKDASAAAQSKHFAICVLPFANMSGDPEQEYFSDGITEDITTDLSKVSALSIISRNGSFMYKGKQVDIPKVAREMKVTHVLEGSVRKAGGRIRISAQLIDGEHNNHVWAERYDREASDIFAIQDEISHAIVKALQLKLLPKEKKAIERRGTESVEAHDLYLMARQMYATNLEADERSAKAIIRLCERATEIDPRYAQAWALMATGFRNLHLLNMRADDGMEATERALALDPNLAEAHAIKAYILLERGDTEAAGAEVAIALKLDPESNEANRTAARLNYRLHRYEDAIRFYEKAASLMEGDLNSAFMLISAYTALGDAAGVRRAAEMSSKRTDTVLAHDQNNSSAVAYSAYALAALGDSERAKSRMNRALLIDPDNFNMRYNFACTLATHLKDKDAAVEVLGPVFAKVTDAFLPYAKADPDFEPLRADPRFQALVTAAEARLDAAKSAEAPDAAAQ
jgi:adenylate cyclase